MDKRTLLADIQAASHAIGVAESELREVVKQIPIAPRASKVKVSEAVMAASVRLSEARANLTHLNVQLVSVEASELIENLAGARASLVEAEMHLDSVVRAMKVDEDAEKAWVTDEVRDAFTNLEAARNRLAELEALADDA